MNDTIFKSNTCPNCGIIESALARSPIPGIDILNIDTDQQARAYLVSYLGVTSVPAAVIDERIIVGASMIMRMLKAKYGRP